MQFIVTHFADLMSILAAVLAVVVMCLHLAHKDSVAQTIQGIEDTLAKLSKPQS